MKIRILTSCTGQKRYSPEDQLNQGDFGRLHEPEAFALLEERLTEYRTPAEDLYTGLQHVRLMEGLRHMRKECGPDSIDLWILSAGYGLIPGDRQIVPYECTFEGMRASEIDDWAMHLNIPQDVRQLFAEPADLVLVLLGDSYLRAIALDESVQFEALTVFFTGRTSQKRVGGRGIARTVLLSNPEATRFSCGSVGLKGEVTKRILVRLAQGGEPFLAKLLDPATDVLDLLENA